MQYKWMRASIDWWRDRAIPHFEKEKILSTQTELNKMFIANIEKVDTLFEKVQQLSEEAVSIEKRKYSTDDGPWTIARRQQIQRGRTPAPPNRTPDHRIGRPSGRVVQPVVQKWSCV